MRATRQRPIKIAVAIALTFAFATIAGSAIARAQKICAQEEAPLFICETDRKDKYLGICATEEKPGERWSAVQYRFGNSDRAELVYPADARQGASKLFFSHESQGTVYHVSIRFQSGGFTYLIESFGDSASDPIGDGAAGVTVTNAAGKTVAQIKCIERPYMFPAYLQRALACDETNPHGKAGCASPAPMVKPAKKKARPR
jgi:hypothetical protein